MTLSQQPSAAAAAAARQVVERAFASHLGGLAPAERSKASLRFTVPRSLQQQLEGLLHVLDSAAAAAAGGSCTGSSRAAAAAAGAVDDADAAALVTELEAAAGCCADVDAAALAAAVADVQLRLTSLDEVFLAIAKQVMARMHSSCCRQAHE